MLINKIIGLVAPDSCISCQKDGELLCYTCFENFKKSEQQKTKQNCLFCKNKIEEKINICSICHNNHKLNDIYFIGYHNGFIKTIIWRLKFYSSISALNSLIKHLYKQMNSLTEKNCYLVYLPTAPSRVRARGFDQAKQIAKNLSKLNKKWQYKNVLIRMNDIDQIGRSKIERKSAAKQMFMLEKAKATKLNKNFNIILVDDVMTTGSTISAAAELFYSHGFKNLFAAVVSYKELE